MKYLFFDLEYASCYGGDRKICEFGYVVSDEQFTVLEQDNFIINPNIKDDEWDYHTLREILTRSKEEYQRCFKFNHFYDKIEKIISGVDYVFGHTIDGDAIALNQNCKRYNLPYINYEFYDLKDIYKNFSNGEKVVSVSGILEEMGVNGLANLHDALADAYNTMLILKNILEKSGKTLTEIIQENSGAKDKTENGIVESIALAEQFLKDHLTGDGTNLFYTELNYKRYKQFIRELWLHHKRKARLRNAKITISKNYLYNHYRQALNLCLLIFEAGGVVKRNEAVLPEIYVTYDAPKELIGEVDEEFEAVMQAKSQGEDIKVINFNQLLEMLNITNQQLENLPMPSFEFLLEKKSKKIKYNGSDNKLANKKDGNADFSTEVKYSDGEGGASIAELLRQKGIAI